MEKILKFFIPIGFVLVIVMLLFTFVIKPVNLNFADTIILNYEYGEKNIHVEITDKNDLKKLKDICKGTAINDFSIPSCGFGTAELVFKGDGKEIVLYPACDSCNTMRLGKKDLYFYNISETERAELVEILKKYDATFPCI